MKRKKGKICLNQKTPFGSLVNAALTVCTAANHVKGALAKIENNFDIFEEPKGSAFVKWLYKVLNLNTKKRRVFEIEYIEDNSGMKKTEKIDLSALSKKYQKLIAAIGSAALKSDFSVLETVEKRRIFSLFLSANKTTA